MQIKNVLEDMEILRATSALPFVSRMVELGEEKYLDGGVADSIPYAACLERGYDKVIIVLTRPLDYVKTPMKPGLIRAFYRRYPAFCRALEDRHERYNAQAAEVARLEREGRVFVIRPDCALELSRLEKDPEKLQAVYDRGVADGKRTLAALRAYLAG